MDKLERLRGCLLGGAIGDAWGSAYENSIEPKSNELVYFPFGNPDNTLTHINWEFTDDTQLTCATIEAMLEDTDLNPEILSKHLLKWYKLGRIIGIGSSTLMALQGLDVGGHWSQVGRRGEFAAGNGAAMRIAPLAFNEKISNERIKEVCWITHYNDEAYSGALAIVIAIRSVLKHTWNGYNNLISEVIKQIPDSKVRDRLYAVEHIEKLEDVGKLGRSGYVVDSVPLAIAAANKVKHLGIERMFQCLIDIGGDTDTNCSMAGQIAGCLLGDKQFPDHLKNKLEKVNGFEKLQGVMHRLYI